MAAEGPADREMGGETADSTRSGAPFDLGDSRDLAAAVRAAWGEPAEAPGRVEVPRPPLNRRGKVQVAADPADPLAHLRGARRRRAAFRLPARIPLFRTTRLLPTTRPGTRTLIATGGAVAAVVASIAVPLVSGATGPPAEIAKRPSSPSTTTTTRDIAPTTAFTYPPETILGPTTTVAPVATAPVVQPASPPATASASAPTATTARPRTTTTRPAPKPTQAPAPTTTQAPPPPPPDDGGGADGSSEPPPYP